MRIQDVLRRKGTMVATIRPDKTVSDLLASLSTHGVGALVVSTDEQTVAGIVSERDVVRRLHEQGVGILDRPVEEIMTSSVHTCGPEDALHDIMRVMTLRRVRHVPVIVDQKLAGLVSIGDIVRHRIEELEDERSQLEHYISG
jgi:CBS domain-containing protein